MAVLLATTMIHPPPAAGGRGLSIEERVRAQIAIDRAYARHLGPAGRTRDADDEREAAERKVRSWLKLSVALGSLWQTTIDDDALEREWSRIRRNSTYPDRLQELYAALDHDPVLIKEGLVRPVLVQRLARNRFEDDAEIHREALREIESLRERVVSGELDPMDPHPRRWKDRSPEVAIKAASDAPALPSDSLPRTAQERHNGRPCAPGGCAQAGPIRNLPGEYVFSVRLNNPGAGPSSVTYKVPKVSWDAWWRSVRDTLDERSIEDVASPVSRVAPAAQADAGVDACIPDDTWRNGAFEGTPSRGAHSTVWTGTEMIVWGGNTTDYYFGRQRHPSLHNGQRYDPVLDTWQQMSAVNRPAQAVGQVALWTGTQMIIWGAGLKSGALYDPLADQWTPMSTDNAPTSNFLERAVWTGREMIVYGGPSTSGRYDPALDTWRPISSVNAPTGFGSTFWTGRKMITWGGSEGALYDPALDEWAPMSTLNAPTTGKGSVAVWTGREMVVWGYGEPNVGGRYDPETDLWHPISLAGAPRPRQFEPAAVWTGGEMIVWGGDGMGHTIAGPGGRYDPELDRWRPMSTVQAPSDRQQPFSAVWTGREFVVWGGWLFDWTVNDGARYDPSLDRWRSTSLGNVPFGGKMTWIGVGVLFGVSGLYDPVLDQLRAVSSVGRPRELYPGKKVWTGRELLVYDFPSSDRSARYDPILDQWSAISLADAPVPGAVVWDGSEMVVWNGLTKRGGRYSPGLDRWTATLNNNAPSPETCPFCVWTGQEMIDLRHPGVRYNPGTDTLTPLAEEGSLPIMTGGDPRTIWTGTDVIADDPYACGGNNCRYHPASDSWSPGPNLVPRVYGYSLVWTGKEIVTWGGQREDLIGPPGKRHDLAQNITRPVSTVDAPSDRIGHDAIWTGREMIVYGGFDVRQNSNSGGKYYLGALEDADNDGFRVCDSDCSDTDATIHPGVEETCNGVDDDCDQIVDEDAALLCDDRDPCTVDSCSGDGGCRHAPAEDGTPCSDGDSCTNGDSCQSGLCEAGLPEPGGPVTISVSLDPVDLGPANHRLVEVKANVSARDACGFTPQILLSTIESSEPDDAGGLGDGATINDIQGADIGSADFSFSLRAERAAQGPGRTYRVVYTAFSATGETASGAAVVTVGRSGRR